MKQPIPLDKAEARARALVATLAPACERIEIAGSIRRRRPMVGDLEIVAISRTRGGGLFGQEEIACISDVLVGLLQAGELRPLKGGPRYRQYRLPHWGESFHLDLFLVRPETWGVQLALRTGPAEFSKALVTPRRYGGRLTDGYMVEGGRLWGPGAKAVATPEEADFLAYAGGWVDPERREA